MAGQKIQLTTPVGRIVAGSLYKGNDKDAEGKPLVTKTGANIGQPRLDYYFALAIPKKPGETHFSQTEWGAKIWQTGHTAFPQAAQSPAFAWKVEDGDSTVPNKKGVKPCDREGWRGNWILKFSGGYAPKVYRAENGAYVPESTPDFLKAGYFAQVNGTVDGNGSQSQPGVYLNHSMVAFSAYGPEISFGPDVNEAGFGQAPLPAGASMVPPASSIPMPASASAIAPPAPVAAIPAVTAPVPVVPNPQFLQVAQGAVVPNPIQSAPVPAVPAVPVPVPPPASPSKVMTALAGGASYESFVAAGWTEANMIAQGYLQA